MKLQCSCSIFLLRTQYGHAIMSKPASIFHRDSFAKYVANFFLISNERQLRELSAADEELR